MEIFNNGKGCRIITNDIVYLYRNEPEATNVAIGYRDKNNNNNMRTRLDLYGGSDYSISGCKFTTISKLEKLTNMSFNLKKDNLLYTPFKNFLKSDNEVIIDDDDLITELGKYVSVKDKGESIDIDIIINKEKIHQYNPNYYEMPDKNFQVFVKNNLPDLRSKIDQNGLDTKERLGILFKNMRNIFEKVIKFGKIKTTYEYSLMKYLDEEQER